MRPRSLTPVTTDDAPDLRSTVDSLQRGLEALRCFRAGEDSLPLDEIAARIGLSRATTQRLVHTLVAHAFLRQIPGSDYYCPDVACQVLGNAVLSTEPLARAALPILQSVADRFDALSVMLAVRERLSMLCLAERRGANQDMGISSQGLSFPIAATVLGRAWLWTQGGPSQSEVIQRIRAEAGQGGRAMSAVYQAFQELETSGYCTSVAEDGVRAWSIAVPLLMNSPDAPGVAALSCSVAGARGDDPLLRGEIGAALLEAARQLRDAVSPNRR
jgi:DNA-binding IclR family transcriptional regulator